MPYLQLLTYGQDLWDAVDSVNNYCGYTSSKFLSHADDQQYHQAVLNFWSTKSSKIWRDLARPTLL